MPAHLTATGPVTLVVAWRTGAHVRGRTVRIGGEVASLLREIAGRAAEQTAHGGRVYDPDDGQGDASHVSADRAELWDTELISVLETGPSLPVATEDELRRRTFACYAVVLGSSERQTVYVRKANPVSLARKPMLAGLVDGTLTKIESPLFAFDDAFDVIVTSGQVYALHQAHFELLFKESEAVLAKAPEWVDRLAQQLPLTPDGQAALVESLRSNSIYRRKLHSILRRPYISSLTPAILEARMRRHGLDVDKLMPGGRLDFAPDNTRELIRLLNEDLFQGDFSQEHYAAGTKSRVGS